MLNKYYFDSSFTKSKHGRFDYLEQALVFTNKKDVNAFYNNTFFAYLHR